MDSLYPPTTDTEKATVALAVIREFMVAERKMRQWVFRAKPDQKEKKLQELDQAFKEVGVLEGILLKTGILK